MMFTTGYPFGNCLLIFRAAVAAGCMYVLHFKLPRTPENGYILPMNRLSSFDKFVFIPI